MNIAKVNVKDECFDCVDQVQIANGGDKHQLLHNVRFGEIKYIPSDQCGDQQCEHEANAYENLKSK